MQENNHCCICFIISINKEHYGIMKEMEYILSRPLCFKDLGFM